MKLVMYLVTTNLIEQDKLKEVKGRTKQYFLFLYIVPLQVILSEQSFKTIKEKNKILCTDMFKRKILQINYDKVKLCMVEVSTKLQRVVIVIEILTIQTNTKFELNFSFTQ